MEKSKRPSKITIPEKANPLAKLVFAEMKRQNRGYYELEWQSGVLVSTIKAWRGDNRPGLETIEACLGALGWALVPVPQMERLPKEVQDGLEALRDLWRREEPLLHHLLAACCEAPNLITKAPKNPPKVPRPTSTSPFHARFGLSEPISIKGRELPLRDIEVITASPIGKGADSSENMPPIRILALLAGTGTTEVKSLCRADLSKLETTMAAASDHYLRLAAQYDTAATEAAKMVAAKSRSQHESLAA